MATGLRRKAETACRVLVVEQPRNADAAHFAGVLFFAEGNRKEGIRWLRRASRLDPANFHYWRDLGLALLAANRLPEAAACLRKALVQRPAEHEVSRHLGECLCSLGEYEAALNVFNAASRSWAEFDMSLRPEIAKLKTWRLEAAIDGLSRFAKREPGNVEAQLGLIGAYFRTGDVSAAIGAAATVEKTAPDRESSSFLCRLLHYDPAASRATISRQQESFAKAYFPPTGRERRFPARHTRGKLRVGYVSALFSQHSLVLKPILQWHDARRFQIYCFSDGQRIADSCAARWIDTARMSDARLAAHIRRLKIDILVECDGHSGGARRLPLFAARSAPVQFALGLYAGTTGIRNIDFKITDPIVDPPGTERYFTEKPVRLSQFACCDPRASEHPGAPLPVSTSGFITFGSFSIPAKLNTGVVRVWAAILRRVPDSRLILHHQFDRPGTGTVNPAVGKRLYGAFRQFGIPRRRLELLGESPAADHLSMYDLVDIALDPFPYNGVMTTFDSLLRGVPVVTLDGDTSAGRVGVSLLSRAGLSQFVARSPREYVRIAADLARDRDSLATLRRGLAARAATALADGKGYVAELEEAYRSAWMPEMPPHDRSPVQYN